MSGSEPRPRYAPEQVSRYFDEYGLAEWERLVRTPASEIKLHVHAHYLRAYVPAGARVLEVGAGPGRFTQMLAEMGCRIVVADISPGQLDLNRQKAGELGFAASVEDWVCLDVCDMAALPGRSFDAVVCYGGPLSYVFEQRDIALGECVRVARPAGTVLLSVMSLWGSAHAFLPGVLSLPVELNREVISTGDTVETDHRCHMYRAAELRRLLARPDLELLAISASNCLSAAWDAPLAEIRADEHRWQELLRMEVEACREEGCLDMGTHLIAVARKRNTDTCPGV